MGAKGGVWREKEEAAREYVRVSTQKNKMGKTIEFPDFEILGRFVFGYVVLDQETSLLDVLIRFSIPINGTGARAVRFPIPKDTKPN